MQYAVFGVSAFALPFVLLLVPVAWMLGTGAFIVCAAVLAALPWRKPAVPAIAEELTDPQLRATYAAILCARDRLETALTEAPRFARYEPALRERCDAAVMACSSLVPAANAVHAGLSRVDAWTLATRIAALRARARQASDPDSAVAITGAADAYDRQLAACAEMMRVRQRIQARLELVLAALRTFASSVAAQQAREDEELALASAAIYDDIADVTGKLTALDAALRLS